MAQAALLEQHKSNAAELEDAKEELATIKDRLAEKAEKLQRYWQVMAISRLLVGSSGESSEKSFRELLNDLEEAVKEVDKSLGSCVLRLRAR